MENPITDNRTLGGLTFATRFVYFLKGFYPIDEKDELFKDYKHLCECAHWLEQYQRKTMTEDEKWYFDNLDNSPWEKPQQEKDFDTYLSSLGVDTDKCPFGENGFVCHNKFAETLLRFLRSIYEDMSGAHPMIEEEYEFIAYEAFALDRYQRELRGERTDYTDETNYFYSRFARSIGALPYPKKHKKKKVTQNKKYEDDVPLTEIMMEFES